MDIAEAGVADKDAKTKPPKTVSIIVNGRERQVEKGELSFEDIIALAFDPVPTGLAEGLDDMPSELADRLVFGGVRA